MRFFVLMLYLLFVQPSFAAEGVPCDTSAIAKQWGPPRLQSMLQQALGRTTTMGMLAAQYGASPIRAKINEEIKKVGALHQNEWNNNLAKSWHGLLTGDDCTQLLRSQPSKKARQSYLKNGKSAGTKMQAISTPLLKKMAGEVLANVWSAYPPKASR